jgi:uracil-DNA glycosylase
MEILLDKIRQCRFCENMLPLGPRPVVQLSAFSKVVIIGQAPGRRVHETGVPWNDASGKTLRKWLNVDDQTFYDPASFTIMPMGFCYPGKASSGDLPPRPECAPLWHRQILANFQTTPLILLIGQYAQHYYLKRSYKGSLTETVRHYDQYLPQYFPLPHPSPRNQNWVKINPWFAEEVIPRLQDEVQKHLKESDN